ncbi:DUF2264 domain-containing protein [Streptomyces sp. NBC_00873]|uniref:DUF2264 domain-containing protein n=1 Tax=unclassified Streptomyces TaxID=2593676 RepID=UPI0038644364|nr:DUF2264 domain-containing protein [Streptomyces sp. NBC_00873]WTA48246.1 DUF2264 domain-containing protein [Streptomyces sp. NBC_00842]
MSSIPLPPEDRALSPYTGWTRAHWEAVADGLLTAALRHTGPEHALISLPGPRPSFSGTRSDALEGFARTFLLAAFRIAGAGGDDPHGFLQRYAEGLAAGTRTPTTDRDLTRRDPVSWLAIGNRNQPMVEAASIALALRLTRPWLWDRLDEQVRERTRVWLTDALHHTPVDNNWWLFPFTVGGFLAHIGADRDGAAQAAVERGLTKIEQWYLGDGWYTDGRPRAFDHYNGWAFHLYPVLHAHLDGDTHLLEVYGPRLATHLDGYARTFGADGSPMHQGRSLTYRFATTAPLWAGALTGHTPLTPGATRRIASGVLRHFVDRGALDADGLLTLGWHGPHLPLVQEYSGPASPYWASKGFLGLLLPPDHPAWTAVEEPAPVERADVVVPLPRPGWLIQSTAADGIARLHNHGSDDQPADRVQPDNPLYARLAHSTATGPVLDGTPDNHVGVLVEGELSERGRIRPLGAGDGWAASVHAPRIRGAELPGVTVTSVVLAAGADEVHAHLVAGAGPGIEMRHSGWAAAGATIEESTDGLFARVLATTPDGARLLSSMENVHGFTEAGTHPLPSGTAYGTVGAVPALGGRTSGRDSLFVGTVRLSGAVTGTGADLQPHAALHVHVEGTRIRVRCPDDSELEALLAPEAVTVTVRTAG